MKILNPEIRLDSFWRQVGSGRDRVLLLDYDGTISPFNAERDQALPYPEVENLLQELVASHGTRTVIVSGRTVENLLNLLQMEHPPELWGSHGAERLRSNGLYEQGAKLGQDEIGILDDLEDGLSRGGWSRHLERKPFGLAIHFRGLDPDRNQELEKAAAKMIFDLGLASFRQIKAHSFDGGIELRPSDISKANVIHAILAEYTVPPAAAYLGDDLTDEDAFLAIKGRGLSVLVRPLPRPTQADVWLRPPAELVEFLRQWRDLAR